MKVPPRPSPRQRGQRHGDLRPALIAAAETLLEQDGPEQLSLRAVARLAGVSQTAPYNHFESRDALLAALATRGFTALSLSQEAIAQAGDEPRVTVIQLGCDYVAAACRRPRLYRLMFGAGLGGEGWHGDPVVAAAKSRSFSPLQATIARLLPATASAEARDDAARACWALVHGLAMMMIDGTIGRQSPDDEGAQDIARRLLTVLLQGLASTIPSETKARSSRRRESRLSRP